MINRHACSFHPGRIGRGIASALGLMLLAGCAPLPESAWNQIGQAKAKYDRQDYRGAIGRLDPILKQHPDHADSAQAYYLRSLCHAKMSNKVRAESDARKCVRLSRDSELTANAHATLATLMFEANRTKEALPHFQKAFKQQVFKSSHGRTNEDALLYRYGLSLQREGRWKEAMKQFESVYKRFPRTTTAQHARRLRDWTHEYYSIQCGAFRQRNAAEAMHGRLQRARLQSRVEPVSRAGEFMYAVYVGKYPRYGQARDALPSVQRQIPDAFVAPR